jgi:hypothetical protein
VNPVKRRQRAAAVVASGNSDQLIRSRMEVVFGKDSIRIWYVPRHPRTMRHKPSQRDGLSVPGKVRICVGQVGPEVPIQRHTLID